MASRTDVIQRVCQLMGIGLAVVASVLAIAGQASAVLTCPVSIPTCSPLTSDPSSANAANCLCASTSFFDSNIRSTVGGAGFTTFDQVLPPSYSSPAPAGYDETKVDEVILWALDAPRSDEKDALLYEATLRKASAHGVFGDDRLIRGLDPTYGGVDAAQSIIVSRENLDSRVCHLPGPPPSQASTPGVVCNVDADCSTGQVCLAKRFSANGTFGAVQEYRRGERAVDTAIQHLGVARFRGLDESGSLCAGAGCAARLLLHLGSQKARAQAERIDLIWRQTVATSGVPTDAPTCAAPAAAVGQYCSLHRDCDRSGVAGRCGSTERDQNQIVLRQIAGEATAEGAAAQVLYSQLLPYTAVTVSSDLRQLQSSLDMIAGVETRSLTGVTPFGLPADYVPLLSSVQEQYLNCVQACSGAGCNQSYNTQCLFKLAEGQNFLNVLEQARQSQTAAQTNAQAFADSLRDRTQHKLDSKQGFRRVIKRLLGSSCAPGSPGCSCPTSAADEGECIEFEGEIWIAEGIRCDDSTNPLAQCKIDGVDGEFERQLLAIRNAELSLSGLQDTLESNAEIYQGSIQDSASLSQIRSDECSQNESVVKTARDSTSSALQTRHNSNNKCNRWCKIKRGLGKGLAIVGKIGVAVGGVIAAAPTGGASLAGSIVVLASTTKSAAGDLIGDIDQAKRNKTREESQLSYDKAINEVSTEKEISLLRIKCGDENNPGTQDRITEVQQNAELRKIEIARREIYQKMLQQQGAILDALVGSRQLLAELSAAREQYEEAVELESLWADASFRNPQNYRAVALAKAMEGADRFRTAQMLTWMILRGVSYDRALPDFPVPQNFTPVSTLQVGANSCKLAVCAGGARSGLACASNAQCGNGSVCQLTNTKAGVADSTGGCSMQAVFAARSVDDLESLIQSAFVALASPGRTLFAACPNGECTKQVKLRNLFGDPNLPDTQRPLLGEKLAQTPVGADLTTKLDFGISLSRGFAVCPSRNDGSCPPGGIANLSRADFDGNGPTTSNMWNARLTTVRGVISYDPKRLPGKLLCRDPYGGDVANASSSACQLPGGGDRPVGFVCGSGCTDSAGNPGQACQCLRLLNTEQTQPVVQLYQVEPGLVRTSLAQVYSGDDVVPRPKDSILRFRPLRGDLPLSINNQALDQTPILSPFGLKSLALADTLGVAPPNFNAKGVPVAGSRWQLRVDTTSLVTSRYRRAFLSAIKDIELYFNFQGFDL